MQVILLEKNQKLGNLGDIANVKSGYARNFLIPQGKAKPATKANIAEFEVIKAELIAKEADILSTAKNLESAMTEVVCTITANASEEGKLYGSVSPADIVESLAKLGHEVEKKDVNMPEAIRHVGEYNVSVALHTDIVVDIKVIVEPSEEEKQ
ncbi:MAG TPA: 50S ribosomal protein L9 [Gammaproteobacteria bacterium]|jgi:large subunit ribosomal protein L9|nr:50S ribosomal protein L9 [Gammaproteobacteria bacterium]HAY41659.1 50S ribosomal protein L9 [Gammaproteobacteria bacterium]|tara:strand:- start:264 stop:722 length:459 start_codon:yes stop_codon:yes gene_type:complete